MVSAYKKIAGLIDRMMNKKGIIEAAS